MAGKKNKNKNKKSPEKRPSDQSTEKSQNNEIAQAYRKQQLVAANFQGPIPPPSILEGYENIVAGSAERIITLAESETHHRHAMEKKALDAEIESMQKEADDTKRGQIFGLLIGMSAILSGTVCAVAGAQLTGVVIGGGGLGSLVSAFIIGRKKSQQSEENQTSKEMMNAQGE